MIGKAKYIISKAIFIIRTIQKLTAITSQHEYL
jgi:hypothetical protein